MKRDDFFAALRLEEPRGSVPIWELEFHLWDAFSGRRLLLGTEFANLTTKEKEKAIYSNAEIFISVAEQLNHSALTVPYWYWELAPNIPAYFWLPEDDRYNQIRVLVEEKPDDLLLVGGVNGVLGIPTSEEYLSFSYLLFDDPVAVDNRAERLLADGLNMARKISDCGVEIIMMPCDLADNHGPYFSPKQMDRFVLPYLSRWTNAVKSFGCLPVLHSDGNLNPCLDNLADSGIVALQAIDPVAGMDLPSTKARVGDRICLCGNIDCGLLISGTPEEIYSATKALLFAAKPGGGFVLGASNAVQMEVAKENYKAMLAAWNDHGSYKSDKK